MNGSREKHIFCSTFSKCCCWLQCALKLKNSPILPMCVYYLYDLPLKSRKNSWNQFSQKKIKGQNQQVVLTFSINLALLVELHSKIIKKLWFWPLRQRVHCVIKFHFLWFFLRKVISRIFYFFLILEHSREGEIHSRYSYRIPTTPNDNAAIFTTKFFHQILQ